MDKETPSLMLKKQLIIIITSLALIIAAVIAYFVITAPMKQAQADAQKEKNPGNIVFDTVDPSELMGKDQKPKEVYDPKTDTMTVSGLLEGEFYEISTDRISIFKSVDTSDIKELEIHNQHGDYGFIPGNNGEFYINGYVDTPKNSTLISYLMAAVRLPVAIQRITTDTSDLTRYGLSPDQDPAYYILTDTKDNEHKIYIGDPLSVGGGYYAMYEGRQAIYALDTSTDYILKPVESYVLPLLSLQTSPEDYQKTECFELSVDGEPYIRVEYMDEEERAQTASTTYYKMVIPENYVPSNSNYDELLKTFNDFSGTEVIKFGARGEVMDLEELAEYKLDESKYTVFYSYQGIENWVFVSEQNEDGSYYAYSLLNNLVARVDNEKLKFLSWDFIDFIDKPMFQKNINDMESIRIEGAGIDESFTITGTNETLAVTRDKTNTKLGSQSLDSFKKLYVKLLSLSLEDYAESTDTSEENWLMTFTVRTRTGIEYEYSFYKYSTRRCFFTINGNGEFYVLRDRVEKILSDTQLLVDGGVVTNELS